MQQKPKLSISTMLQQAIALHQQARLAQAEEIYKRILQIDKKHFDALHMLGVIAMQRNCPADAITFIVKAIAFNPKQESAHLNLGYAYGLLKRHEDALASYGRALKLKPDYADAHNNRGNTLLDLKRYEEALACYDRALLLQPAHANACSNRGIVLGELKRHEEALASHERAVALKPNDAEAHRGRGNALFDLKRYAEALESYDHALLLKPDFPEAHRNRGRALYELNRFEEALASHDRALALRPDYVEAYSNRGNALCDLARHEEALASYARALALNPDYAEAHLNEGFCRLRLGDMETGWKKYEWRWDVESAPPKRDFSQPLWLGDAPLTGKIILLHAEQGLGDTIQFIRYAGKVASQGATVLLEVQAPLKELLASVPGVTHIFAKGEALPPFDFHCPLLSLPLACGTRLDDIPNPDGFLHIDPERQAKWRGMLGTTTLPRIGLVWSGNASHKNDRNRSIPLTQLATLLSNEAEFFSLQKDVRADDRPLLDRHPKLRRLGTELEDFADTAAAISLMDLVITVDTSIAHLAGTLGKPVWVLLPFTPDWRWMLERTDSPWYPSARLFRQDAAGDWRSVIEGIGRALSEMVEHKETYRA